MRRCRYSSGGLGELKGGKVSLYTLLQILSVTVFEKMPLQQAFSSNEYRLEEAMASNQLNLFGS